MTETRPARTRHPKAVTRANILQKGYEMYLDRRLEHGNERLSVVLDELGYTTGAGYQIWDNQAEFRRDLNIFVAENIEYASLKNLAANIGQRRRAALSFEEVVLQGGDDYASLFLGREEFYLTLRFLAMGDERPDAVTEAIRDGYTRLTWEAIELFEATLTRFDRKVKAPFQMTDLTTAATALLEGYALRARVEPELATRRVEYEGASHHVFSVGFLGIIEAFTEKIPDAA